LVEEDRGNLISDERQIVVGMNTAWKTFFLALRSRYPSSKSWLLHLKGKSRAVLTGGILFAVSASAAADETPAAVLANSIGIEFAPEFRTSSGALTDDYLKATFAHSFESGLIWSGTFQYTDKIDGDPKYRIETTFGYNIRMDDSWSIPVSGGVGFRWDEDPAALPGTTFAYYVVNVGLNMRISDHWTWNTFSARWRDAFEGGWQTPKIYTGLTYTIDRSSSVYANVGEAWKNGQADKVVVAVGYKYAF
jgi:hypothetical protein